MLLKRVVFPRTDWQRTDWASLAVKEFNTARSQQRAALDFLAGSFRLPPAVGLLPLWPHAWVDTGPVLWASAIIDPIIRSEHRPALDQLIQSDFPTRPQPPLRLTWYDWTIPGPLVFYEADQQIRKQRPALDALLQSFRAPNRTGLLRLDLHRWSVPGPELWFGFDNNPALVTLRRQWPAIATMPRTFRTPERRGLLPLWNQSWQGPYGWFTSPLDLKWKKESEATSVTWTKESDPGATTWTKESDPSATTWTKEQHPS